MAGHVEVEFAAGDVVQVEIGEDLGFTHRGTGEDFAERGDDEAFSVDEAALGAEIFGPIGLSEVLAGADRTKQRPSMAMWRMLTCQMGRESTVGAHHSSTP